MDLAADFKSYQERITTSLVNVTRTASQISNQDLSFHRSASEKFSQSLDGRTTHLLRLTNKLLKAASKDSSLRPPSLKNADDVEDNWRKVVDVVDDLLEKADASLDEFTGVLKRMSPADQDLGEPSVKRQKLGQGVGLDVLALSVVARPQDLFLHKVNNYETGPWKPLLETKPHALISLEESIGSGDEGYKHPYAYEIQNLEYPQTVFEPSEPIPFSPPDDSEPIFVDTEEGVHLMLAELKLATEIAVDLEHNDKNSYIGMVCLMQISTRDKDWIVDTLKPWRQNLQVLNEIFANPKVVKVFHGSTSDIIWLQRDLGLYVVGLFDTYYASNALAFPQKSLKYLLQRFANFEAQKQFQLADWRIRPLPKELLDYARSDTHFLLYVFDNLRNMLLEASPDHESMNFVLEHSKKESLQVYERPVYDRENGLGSGGWLRMLMSRSTGFTNEQFGVFRALHEWRDQKARELDEGEQNIMPNQYIFLYAEHMPIRRPMFFQRGMSMGRLPPRITELIPEIISVIWKGREEGKKGPSIYEAIEKNGDKVGFMFGRNKYPRKKTEDTHHGVGATLQLLNQTGGLAESSPAQPSDVDNDAPLVARNTSSQLFGGINMTPPSATLDFAIVARALQTILPFDPSAIQIAEAGSLNRDAVPAPPVQPNPITNPILQVTESKPDTFILRDRSKKRKAEESLAVEGDSSPSTNVVNQTDANSELTGAADDPLREDKRQRKAEKKARKAQQEAQRRAAQENVVPFDYSNAESILHAKPDSADTTTTNKVKPLNPFARAADTSTGARRNKAGKELAGKSHTFTS